MGFKPVNFPLNQSIDLGETERNGTPWSGGEVHMLWPTYPLVWLDISSGFLGVCLKYLTPNTHVMGKMNENHDIFTQTHMVFNFCNPLTYCTRMQVQVLVIR